MTKESSILGDGKNRLRRIRNFPRTMKTVSSRGWNTGMTSKFEQFVFSGPVNEGAFEPMATYDPDGDCIEFLASNESFRRERLDSLVTVYIGRESNEVIGSFIKGVSKYI